MLPDKARGFLSFHREHADEEAPSQRVKHYHEFSQLPAQEGLRNQAYRCMNCGIPFCISGCPLGNQIPDFNELVKDEDWEAAVYLLHGTNNFPEFTGRVCPAPCENACVLGINEPAVTIEMIERAIGDRGWQEGWIKPEPAENTTGKRVAVVGSGPSGLAAAQQLARVGHEVTVYERDDEPGGLLMYGIPNFKLDKNLVRRRVEQMKAEGVIFRCNAEVGKTVPTSELQQYDAVLLATGSTVGRTFKGMNVPGSDLNGIHLAMEFLPQQTRRVLGKQVEVTEILATGKDVIVLGGGDTGSDCIGTSLRQGCKSLVNFEVMPKPSQDREPDNPWPQWAFIHRTSSSHEEGGERQYSILTKRFEDDGNGNVAALHTVRLEWSKPDKDGRRRMTEIPNTEQRFPADLVLLAMGFTQPETDTVVKDLGLELERNRFGQGIKAAYQRYMTSKPGVFAAGDARRGQSLVVWAIHEGREAARAIDVFLMGHSELPSRDAHVYPSPEEVGSPA